MHFTWYEYLFHIEYKMVYVAASIFMTVFVIAFSLAAKVALGSGETAIIPVDRFSIRGIAEMLTEAMAGMCEMIFGHHGMKYLPHFASIFTFILFNNLISLVPGFTAATSNINAACAVAIVSFTFYNVLGLMHGKQHYLAHFLGPALPIFGIAIPILAPLMLPIEIISHVIRPLTLSLRLSINMSVDHIVLGSFTELTKIVIPVAFYVLGTLVSVVQALVFTLLSMVYVMLATADDH